MIQYEGERRPENMRTNGDALKPFGGEILEGWKQIRSWAERVWSRERAAEAGLAGFSLILYGFIFYCLHHGVNNQVFVGF
jgi:hypothetical protein